MLRFLTKFFVLGAVLIAAYSNADSNNELFRYKNKSGVTVINNSIPAEFAQKGYEIITRTGEVVKTIEAAPTGDDIARANRVKNVLSQYEPLRRRYSNIEAIERAKQRKLQGINTNISILRGTILNQTSLLDDLMAQAAQRERAGRAVPKTMIKQIDDIKAEIRVSENLLAKRQLEYSEIEKKYENDKVVFTEGKQLEKQRNNN